jgi:NAD(P)-dependent dehydrogenase (short-subunit alcohol dehydrogenase family)
MRDPSVDNKLLQATKSESLPVIIRGLDVTDGVAIRDVVAGVIAERGGIDILVNNAGTGFIEAIEELDENRARLVWETNFWGPIRLCQSVLAHMRSRGAGVIINVSSAGARLPGAPGLAMYSATKQALSCITESLRAEVAGTGVRAVAIEPGFYATQIYDRNHTEINPSSPYASIVGQTDARIAQGIAGGGHPSAVADAIVAAAYEPETPVRVLVGDDARAFLQPPAGGGMAS